MIDSVINLAATQIGQVTIVLTFVGLLHQLLAERAPRLMTGLWTVAAIKALTPPIVSSPIGLFSWAQAARVAASDAGAGPLVVDWTGDSPERASWLAAALALWATGIAVVTGTTLVRRWRLKRSLRRDAISSNDPLHRYIVGLAERYGLRPPCTVVVSQEQLGPAVAGVRRPTVILPARLVADRDPAVLRPILLHELVHTTRCDTLSAWLLNAARTIWWFHPLVWWGTRKAEGLVERCVDLAVTRDLQTSLADYGRSLLRVLELRAELTPQSQLASLRPCQITAERINFLRDRGVASGDRVHGSPLGRIARVAVCTFTALLLLPALPVDALTTQCEPGEPCSIAAEAEPLSMNGSSPTA